MKVYVVLKTIPYEGDEIVGIYATASLAELVREPLNRLEHYYTYSVKEYEVLNAP